jgi:hypothetical protein
MMQGKMEYLGMTSGGANQKSPMIIPYNPLLLQNASF